MQPSVILLYLVITQTYHMKRLLFFISAALIVTGCSKSSTVKPTITLTGTYVSYRETDTSYNAFNVADGIEYIQIYTATGDTLYNYPGTANANSYFGPPATNPANGAADGQVTITFNSSNTATENEPHLVPTYITYNLKSGTFSDGRIGMRERIVAIDANNVELITNPISVDNQPNTSGYMTAIYFTKQ